MGHARAILGASDPEDAARQIVAGGLSVRQAEALAKRGVTRVAVPISSGAGLPAQVKTPDDVLRYGKDKSSAIDGIRRVSAPGSGSGGSVAPPGLSISIEHPHFAQRVLTRARPPSPRRRQRRFAPPRRESPRGARAAAPADGNACRR